jgi:hypothetical protein
MPAPMTLRVRWSVSMRRVARCWARPGSRCLWGPATPPGTMRRMSAAASPSFTEPWRGWRHVTVGARRTRREFAPCVTDLVDRQYPDAERIVLVMDQLNIHSTASLYAAFPPAEARRLAEKLEMHHTPQHGSWLNMAELELSVLARQCLATRLPTEAAMRDAVTAWAERRTAATQRIDWQFTTDDARVKLRRLYPAFDA